PEVRPELAGIDHFAAQPQAAQPAVVAHGGGQHARLHWGAARGGVDAEADLARSVGPQNDLDEWAGPVAKRLGRKVEGQLLRSAASLLSSRRRGRGLPRGGGNVRGVAGP